MIFRRAQSRGDPPGANMELRRNTLLLISINIQGTFPAIPRGGVCIPLRVTTLGMSWAGVIYSAPSLDCFVQLQGDEVRAQAPLVS